MSSEFGRSARLPATLADRLDSGPVVLDGGLATLLEAHGHDLASALWSARLLAHNPEAIAAAHREYFAAGAQVAITASYQASFQGFAELGLDRAAAEQMFMGCSVIITSTGASAAVNASWPDEPRCTDTTTSSSHTAARAGSPRRAPPTTG